MTKIVVVWHGDEFLKRVDRAQRLAIYETTAAAALEAQKDLYPGHGLITGLLQGSIKSEQARRIPTGWMGIWGSFDVLYAVFIEIRYGFLRKAAEGEYPKLLGRIKDWL